MVIKPADTSVPGRVVVHGIDDYFLPANAWTGSSWRLPNGIASTTIWLRAAACCGVAALARGPNWASSLVSVSGQWLDRNCLVAAAYRRRRNRATDFSTTDQSDLHVSTLAGETFRRTEPEVPSALVFRTAGIHETDVACEVKRPCQQQGATVAHRYGWRMTPARPADSSRSCRVPTEFRTGLVVILIAIIMTSTFAITYTVALGRPVPRHIPLAVVGPQSATAEVTSTLLRSPQHDISPLPYSSVESAVAAVAEGTVSGVLDAGSNPPRLLVSSASDASTARILEQIATNVEPAGVRVADLYPLPPSDPQGLATFYVVIAATILGFVTMFQLRANLTKVTLRQWLSLTAVLSTFGGIALSLAVGPVLGALHPPFVQLWLLLCVQIAIAALFNSTMLVLIGRWAIIPTWTLFIVLGNTSSGGAVSAVLLPEPFAFLNHALPTGATVSAIHAITYFPDHQRALPVVVLVIWFVLTLAALVISVRLSGRSPLPSS